MNIYDAMMKAADYIESNPNALNIYNIMIPLDKNGAGCALGWTGYFLGLTDRVYNNVHPLLGVKDPNSSREYFERMNALQGKEPGVWFHDSARCARTMRLYASKYHALTRRTDSELVAALMRKISTERMPEDA